MAVERRIIGLTETDKERVQGLLDEADERLENEPYRDTPTREPADTTEVYIAKTPSATEEPPGGIPALTVRPGSFDRPGFAKCRVWRVSIIDDGVPEMRPIEDKKLRVYNLSTKDVPPETWVLVQRSKSGAWISQSAIGGGQATLALVTSQMDGAYNKGYLLDLQSFNPNDLTIRQGPEIRVLNAAALRVTS